MFIVSFFLYCRFVFKIHWALFFFFLLFSQVCIVLYWQFLINLYFFSFFFCKFSCLTHLKPLKWTEDILNFFVLHCLHLLASFTSYCKETCRSDDFRFTGGGSVWFHWCPKVTWYKWNATFLQTKFKSWSVSIKFCQI